MRDYTCGIILIACALVFGFFIGSCYGFMCGEKQLKKEAVKSDKAEYVVDKEGNVTWRWK